MCGYFVIICIYKCKVYDIHNKTIMMNSLISLLYMEIGTEWVYNEVDY